MAGNVHVRLCLLDLFLGSILIISLAKRPVGSPTFETLRHVVVHNITDMRLVHTLLMSFPLFRLMQISPSRKR